MQRLEWCAECTECTGVYASMQLLSGALSARSALRGAESLACVKWGAGANMRAKMSMRSSRCFSSSSAARSCAPTRHAHDERDAHARVARARAHACMHLGVARQLDDLPRERLLPLLLPLLNRPLQVGHLRTRERAHK